MPELPEVEMFRRSLEPLVGSRFDALDVMDMGVVLGKQMALQESLVNNRLLGLERHGKYLFMIMNGDMDVMVHFGMSGSPHLVRQGEEVPYTRVRLETRDGLSLCLSWVRKLGRIGAISSMGAFIQDRGLGPDALQVGEDEFVKSLLSGRRAVKAKLLDQSVVAGLGNLYVDEILFQTCISPTRPVDRIDLMEGRILYRTIRRVLKASLSVSTDFSSLEEGHLLRIRGDGSLCPRCGERLGRLTIAGRTTYHCPECQL